MLHVNDRLHAIAVILHSAT